MNSNEAYRVEMHLRRLGFNDTTCVMWGSNIVVYGLNRNEDVRVEFETWMQWLRCISDKRKKRQVAP
jgi:hypothetical protein